MASALDLSVIDALPYVDTLIDENPQARADAESLIRKEMKRFDPTAHYEETLGPLYVPTFCGSTLLQKEFSRVVSQKEQKGGAVNEPLKAYVSNILEIPPKMSANEDICREEWIKAIKQLKQSIEYHNNWLVNAELAKKYGPSAARAHAVAQEGIEKYAKFTGDSIASELLKINKDRKSAQLEAGGELNALVNEIESCITKNNAISRLLFKRGGDTVEENQAKRQRKE